MAEELEIGRLVASFTLDISELEENAEEAEEILDDLEKKAQNTKPKVTADTGEVTEKTKEAEKAIEDVGEKAKNIKPKIDIDMDVDKVVKKAEEAENAIDEVENKAKETKPELPEPKTEKYETALEKLTKLISEQKITLNNLKKEYQNAALEQGKDSQKVQELDEAIRELNEELQKNIKTFNDAQYSDNEYNEEIENTEKTAEEAEEAIDDLNESTEQLSGGFTVAKGAAADLVSKGLQVVASKTIEIGKDIINTGEQFTAAMSEVAAISGATGAELEKLEQTARQYGATTEFSAIETAQALKYMALAGWDVETSIAALPGVLDLAAASGMDLAQASDMVTDYLSAFNMEAEQSAYFADLLTYAQGHSNTSTEQLGQAYRNCAANLNAAGQDVETVTSMLEAMANQGKRGSEAGTTMSAIMRDLTDKMENGAVKIGDTSVKVKDAEGNFRDLTDIMKDVEKAVDGLGSADKTAALSATFTQEAINGVNLVLNEGVENISGYEEALRNSGGAAADAAKQMNDNLSGDIKTMQSAFEELALKIYDDGETPLRSFVQTVTKVGVPAVEGIFLDSICSPLSIEPLSLY